MLTITPFGVIILLAQVEYKIHKKGEKKMKRPDPFYLTTYKLYKSLPKVAVAIAIVVSMIIAVKRDSFGVFLLGAIACGVVYLITTMTIAPVILQTDALLALQENMCSNDDEDEEYEKEGENGFNSSRPAERIIDYSCDSIDIGDKTLSGRCLICGKKDSTLVFCKIKNWMGTRELYICDDCKEKYQNNIIKK